MLWVYESKVIFDYVEFSHFYVCNNEDVPQVMKFMFFPIKKIMIKELTVAGLARP